MMDVAHFDGACEPRNPGGTGGWGYAIHDSDGVVLAEASGVLAANPQMSNNVAEYTAALRCIERYLDLGRPGPLEVRGDSMLVIQQMRGYWRIKSGFYKPFALKLRKLLEELRGRGPVIVWRHVYREQNGIADELSKRELKRAGVRFRIQPEE